MQYSLMGTSVVIARNPEPNPRNSIRINKRNKKFINVATNKAKEEFRKRGGCQM